MSEEKNEFFDYDSYVKENGDKKNTVKNGDEKKSNTNSNTKNGAKNTNNQKKKKNKKPPVQAKQEPPKLVPADENDKAAASPKKKQDKESIENIKRMFDEALDESHEEMAELTETQTVPDMPETNPEGLRRKLYYISGIIITLLAIVGLFSTVGFAVDKIKDFADNTQQKNEFAKFVYPIVICDPAPFDQTVKLRSETMITAAIWDIILYEDKTKYEADFDMIIVPEVDVERHCTTLFGTGLSFEHQSIIGADIQFYYDESIKSYRIPSNPKYFTYSPYVEEITRVGERYTLTVGYVSPTPAWLTLDENDEPVTDKYMEYIVSKRGDEMTLVSIQESDKKGQSYYEHYGIEETEQK